MDGELVASATKHFLVDLSVDHVTVGGANHGGSVEVGWTQ